jgi:hypothetical protein
LLAETPPREWPPLIDMAINRANAIRALADALAATPPDDWAAAKHLAVGVSV